MIGRDDCSSDRPLLLVTANFGSLTASRVKTEQEQVRTGDFEEGGMAIIFQAELIPITYSAFLVGAAAGG